MGQNIYNYISDKQLVSRIYKELLQLDNKRQPSLKTGQRFEQIFLQKSYTNIQEVYEKSSILLLVREIRTKTTMRYHFQDDKMKKRKKTGNIKFW